MDATEGDARALHGRVAGELLPKAVAGSSIEIASSWTPSAGENAEKDTPMDLGSRAGGPERRHIHTILFDHLGAVYRDDDPVPVDLALDHGYDGIVAMWMDAAEGDARGLQQRVAAELLPKTLAGSAIEIASSWTPSAGENAEKDTPMDLGSRAGGPERLLHLFFLHGDVREGLDPIRAYSDALTSQGLAAVRLVAPFFRTVPGTDKYVDELW
jgi:hypothetical protein